MLRLGKRWIRFLLCFALLGAVPLQEGQAWGPAGHRIAAHIAEMNLNPVIFQTIQQEFNIKHLANVATWADDIKKRPNAPPVLHYTNIAFGRKTYDQRRDCPLKNCVTEKISEYQDVLADPTLSRKKRKEALKFLIHLVADVHQPMHLGYEKDRGGNEIPVIFREKPTNLHRVWDHDLIDLRGNSQLKFARILNRSISSDLKKQWLEGGPVDWSNESRTLVLEYGYLLKFSSGRQLAEEYIQQGRRVVEEQLRRAGVRLAAMLNETLK